MPLDPLQYWAPLPAAKLILLPDVPRRLERGCRKVLEHLRSFARRGPDVNFGSRDRLVLQRHLLYNILLLKHSLGDIIFNLLFWLLLFPLAATTALWSPRPSTR